MTVSYKCQIVTVLKNTKTCKNRSWSQHVAPTFTCYSKAERNHLFEKVLRTVRSRWNHTKYSVKLGSQTTEPWWTVLSSVRKGQKCSFFFKRTTFVGSVWSFGFFIPTTTANDLWLWRIFYPRLYPLHLFSYLNSSERASISLFNVHCQTRELPGTNFITSLVWRGPWLDIEPGTSHTRYQHSTTRLSRRRFNLWSWTVWLARVSLYRQQISLHYQKPRLTRF